MAIVDVVAHWYLPAGSTIAPRHTRLAVLLRNAAVPGGRVASASRGAKSLPAGTANVVDDENT
eukprot:3160501-Rhodomonas_salina.1